MRCRVTLSLLLATLLLAPASAVAQRVAVHEGYWISFGLGGGWADDEFFDGGQPGFGSWLRMGGSPSQRLLLGGEVIGWLGSDDGTNTDVFRGQLQLVGLYYPSTSGGLFLKGGAGFASRSVDTSILIDDEDFTLTRDSEGVGLNTGIGWDLQVARNFFLTPNVDLLYQFLGEGQSGAVVLITVGATWH
ncbi:MAG: autotransporter domain-containing protein [Gemmatimonadota bacterium]